MKTNEFYEDQYLPSNAKEQYYQVDMPEMNRLFGEPVLQIFICAELQQNYYLSQIDNQSVAEKLSIEWDCQVSSVSVEKVRKRMKSFKITDGGSFQKFLTVEQNQELEALEEEKIREELVEKEEQERNEKKEMERIERQRIELEEKEKFEKAKQKADFKKEVKRLKKQQKQLNRQNEKKSELIKLIESSSSKSQSLDNYFESKSESNSDITTEEKSAQQSEISDEMEQNSEVNNESSQVDYSSTSNISCNDLFSALEMTEEESQKNEEIKLKSDQTEIPIQASAKKKKSKKLKKVKKPKTLSNSQKVEADETQKDVPMQNDDIKAETENSNITLPSNESTTQESTNIISSQDTDISYTDLFGNTFHDNDQNQKSEEDDEMTTTKIEDAIILEVQSPPTKISESQNLEKAQKQLNAIVKEETPDEVSSVQTSDPDKFAIEEIDDFIVSKKHQVFDSINDLRDKFINPITKLHLRNSVKEQENMQNGKIDSMYFIREGTSSNLFVKCGVQQKLDSHGKYVYNSKCNKAAKQCKFKVKFSFDKNQDGEIVNIRFQKVSHNHHSLKCHNL